MILTALFLRIAINHYTTSTATVLYTIWSQNNAY